MAAPTAHQQRAPFRAPFLTADDYRRCEGLARHPVLIAMERGGAEPGPYWIQRAHMQIIAPPKEQDDMRWADLDRNYVQPLEGRLFPVPARVPVQTFGRAAPRSPFAQPPRERPFWRVTTALLVIACAVLVIAGTDLLRAAWAAWGGAR